MQAGPAGAVRDVDVGEPGEERRGAPQGVGGRRHVEGRAPVLVPGVDVGLVVEQHLHHLTRLEVGGGGWWRGKDGGKVNRR